MNNQPKLSIGLPVYNGERFLEAALDSLLEQTFQDFEIIISDNASTDKTAEICKSYVAKDSRISYYRNDTNIGCARNFNRVFELSSGEYFKWASYDDLHHPTFLTKCIEVLDENPSIILCHSLVKFIDEKTQIIGNYDIHFHTDSFKVHQRFDELLAKHLCYQCYGVIRRSALNLAPLMGGYGAADAIFLLRLSLLGRFYEVPEYLFLARHHSQQSLSMFFPEYLKFANNKNRHELKLLPDFYSYAVWFDSNNKGKILLPHWRIFWEYLRSASMGNMNIYERLCCHISIINKLKGTEYLLIKDIWSASKSLWEIVPKLSISIKIELRRPSVL